MNKLPLASVLPLVTLLACAPTDVDQPVDDADETEEALIQGPDTATTEAVGGETSLVVIAGNVKLTMRPTWERVDRDGQPYIRLAGSSSRNLDNVFSFVFDDAFGEARLLTKRKFEILIPATGSSELNTILAGGGLYLQITPSSGTTSYTARFLTTPALSDFDGTSALDVDRLVRPVYVADGVTNLLYRGAATTKAVYTSLAVSTDAGADPVVAARTSKSYVFDWTFADVRSLIDTPDMAFTLTKPNVTRTKTASLEVALRSVSLTTLDPYDTWGNRECDPAVLACIQGLPAGTTDFGDCGFYYDVQICKILNP
ncbi:MAG: hypothetical protein JNL21_07495 [Myxococcales bacterium]|nr:hypothetical protein [Myxococcales bacterium]